MRLFWVGFIMGAFCMFLAMLVLGCESPSEVILSSKKVGVVEPPGRPPLPEGWVVVGDFYVNTLTNDTL